MGNDSAPGSKSLPLDDVFDALSSEHRRHAVYALDEFGPMDSEKLADVVTGWLCANGGGVATRADREQVRTRLHHVHLPKLDAANLVDYDLESGRATPTVESKRLTELLDWSARHEP